MDGGGQKQIADGLGRVSRSEPVDLVRARCVARPSTRRDWTG
jgi:hypothetical protein